ncbi:MAG: trehalase family glycosidase [Acidobacteriota bacterium]|nr:trehalase family glycosidase [Acidobacteriota bacterium]
MIPPKYDTSSPAELDRLAADARLKIGGLKSRILRKANGALPYDYIVPNGVYEEQWDWDAFFVGLHLVSADRANGIYLKNWCLNFLRHTEPDGQTPGGIRPWAGRDARLYHIKPLMGQAAYYASIALGDFGWIEPVWDKMTRCVTYRERAMSDAATGLVKWWDSMESGADNNASLVRRYHNSMAAGDVNGFMVLDYRAMAVVAAKLGRKEEAAAFAERARRLAAAVNAVLWDETDATYYTYDAVEKTLVRRDVYSNLIPLWARIAPLERARALIERYVLNPAKLWAPHGVRSLAADDPAYNNENVIKPYSNWQGPIWPHANWMVMHALLHYGYPEAALAVAERVTRLCLKDLDENGMMRENYHADTGAPLAAPDFISWNLLVAQMIDEARDGIFQPDPSQALFQA